jgi:hypothetical protein
MIEGDLDLNSENLYGMVSSYAESNPTSSGFVRAGVGDFQRRGDSLNPPLKMSGGKKRERTSRQRIGIKRRELDFWNRKEKSFREKKVNFFFFITPLFSPKYLRIFRKQFIFDLSKTIETFNRPFL